MNFKRQSFREENLIKMAMRGDLESFNQLVLRYQDVAYHHACTILKDIATAEDATQDSFFRAFQSMAGFRGGSFRAWILKIVTNSAYDALRRLKRRPIESLLPDDDYSGEIESPAWHADPTVSVEKIVEQAEFLTYLSQLLAELPEVDHAVLTLIDMYEFDYAEAAQILNVPTGTVKSRLARARLQMSSKLGEAKKYVVLP
ncbi:MAG TPA: RNA polymerase sigma factor, partial [Anaerolineales bacterium]|nr:RNA polymerase sigma factor [Anaerolineales bacterium]